LHNLFIKYRIAKFKKKILAKFRIFFIPKIDARKIKDAGHQIKNSPKK